jgi:signal transduction histidine kinase
MTHDEFLALMNHELRGAIGAMSAAAQVLKSCDPAGADAAEAREVVERQSQRMAAALDELLQLGRLMAEGPASTQRVDLVALLRDEGRVHLHSELDEMWLRTDAALLVHSLSLLAAQAPSRVQARIAPAQKKTAGVLAMEPVAGGVAVHAVRVLLEHAGADVRIDTGAEGRRLVAELPH